MHRMSLKKILKNQTEKDADEIEHDMSNAHFELVLRKKILAFSQVAFLAYRGFRAKGQVLLNLLYTPPEAMGAKSQSGSIHFTLDEVAEGEHALEFPSLLSTRFPRLEQKKESRGFKLRDAAQLQNKEFETLIVYGDLCRVQSSKRAPSAARAMKVVKRGRGYNQTYIIRKQAPHSNPSTRRETFFRCGNYCYQANLDLGCRKCLLGNVPQIIPVLQKQQPNLTYLHEIEHALSTPSSPFHQAVCELETANQFIQEQLGQVEDLLTEAISEHKFLAEWIKGNWQKANIIAVNKDNSYHIRFQRDKQVVRNVLATDIRKANGETTKERFTKLEEVSARRLELFFEMKTKNLTALQGIELIASKTYLNELVLVLIYHEDSFFIRLLDANVAGRGQALLDVSYPDLSAKGRGHLLKEYESEYANYTHLFLWCPSGDTRKATPVAKAAPATAGKEEKQEGKSGDVLMANAAYIQTYVVLKEVVEERITTRRDVLFRFGRWCYSGNVLLGARKLQREDIPLVAPVLQSQQSELQYYCLSEKFKADSDFAVPMKNMSEATNFLFTVVIDAIGELEFLSERNPVDYHWLSENSTITTLFELKTDGKHQPAAVDLLATKTYLKGTECIIVYFNGSYYLTLQDAETSSSKGHALLDAYFPSISNIGRGYNMDCGWRDRFADPSFHFRDLTVWEVLPSTTPKEFAEIRTAREMQAARGKVAFAAAAAAAKSRKAKKKKKAAADSKTADKDDAKVAAASAPAAAAAKTIASEFEVHKLSREDRIKMVEQQRQQELAKLKKTQNQKSTPKVSKPVEGKHESDEEEEEDEPLAAYQVKAPRRLEKLTHIPARPILEELKAKGFGSKPAPWERNGRPADPVLAASAAKQLAK